ncbi:MAG: hypothetical protein IJB82_04960 [Bacilli bacterium]|nr:hypothetical protein [Bacilli bacterium]
MSYKYSKDYDEIIDVIADTEFINNFLLLEPNVGYNVVREQLYRIYELECNERKLALVPAKGKELWYEEEYQLNYRIQSRAQTLIETIKIRYISTKRPELGQEIISMLESYENEVVNLTIEILKSCLFLFDTKGTNVIFDKERDVERYKQLYDELTSSQLELQQQGKQKLLSRQNPMLCKDN